MSTRSENTVTINQSAEKVRQALTNEKYWAYIAENLSPEPGELNQFANNEATLFELLPGTILPEAGELAGDKAGLSYTADVKGTPVDFKGTIKLEGQGETTTLSYTNDVSVNIPMMGAAIEPKVGEALDELFSNEGELTEKWISENL